ncbi:MAG: alkaline phosphatase family protein [Actinobacteria bacterium]|nr:alkaline phosphatase family protein [Actinomycetota bacterium]
MKRLPVVLAALAALSALVTSVALASPGASAEGPAANQQVIALGGPKTPITHVVEIFQENVSFDHYFGTYPNAANTDGQSFSPMPGTPAVDGLPPATSPSLPASLRHTTNLLTANPNAAQPKRLDSSPTGLPGGAGGQLTCDQDHNYSDEQKAFDSGKMDKFIESLGTGGGSSPFGAPCNKETVMDYYDGNSVTALWNYAQHYAMSDNSYGTTFGPSSPGAINLISGDTGSVDMTHTANNPSISTPTSPNADLTANGKGGYALTSDAQPYWDDCSTRDAVALSGKNIGDLLNEAGLSWGWFEGGFRPTTSYQAALEATGHAGQSTSTFVPDEFKPAELNKAVPHSSNQGLCDAVSPIGEGLGGTGQWGYKDDYIPHHEPFQYYASTANPHHLTIPTNGKGRDTLAGLSTIGTDTQSYVNGQPQFNTPNHNYDTSDFDQLMSAITNRELPASAMPAVSFLKAPGYQDGHAAYSDPQDEQEFLAHTINEIMSSPDWKHTAIVINYDDSDGWYDHANPGVLNPSLSAADNLTNTTLSGATSGQCGPSPQTTAPLGGEQGRCGLGPRLPMLVVSPFAKSNSVDHNLSNQASTINFIEYNWGLPGISGSFDQAQANIDRSEHVPFDLAGMFQFSEHTAPAVPLNPVTGQPVETEEEEGYEMPRGGGGHPGWGHGHGSWGHGW